MDKDTPFTLHLLAVKPVLKDYPIGHKNVVSHDRWSLVTDSVLLKCRTFYLEVVVLESSGHSQHKFLKTGFAVVFVIIFSRQVSL